MDGAQPQRALRPTLEGLESIISLSAASSRPTRVAPGVVGSVQAGAVSTRVPEKSFPPHSDTLEVRLTTDRKVYRIGQPVRITLTETAVGQWPVRLGGTPQAYVRAFAPGATLWSTPATGFSLANTVYLEPGQSRRTTVVWTPTRGQGAPAPSGLVTIEGTLDTVSGPPISIRILGGRA